MDKKKNNEHPDIKPDLKHDSMEYSAATDGDDILDTDMQREPDEISAEEIDALEDDDLDDQAAALESVEEDREADNDINFSEADNEADDEDEGEAARHQR
ncbi:MAG: hypothetical protein ABJA78_15450 [Ferruginibacter sp.]